MKRPLVSLLFSFLFIVPLWAQDEMATSKVDSVSYERANASKKIILGSILVTGKIEWQTDASYSKGRGAIFSTNIRHRPWRGGHVSHDLIENIEVNTLGSRYSKGDAFLVAPYAGTDYYKRFAPKYHIFGSVMGGYHWYTEVKGHTRAPIFNTVTGVSYQHQQKYILRVLVPFGHYVDETETHKISPNKSNVALLGRGNLYIYADNRQNIWLEALAGHTWQWTGNKEYRSAVAKASAVYRAGLGYGIFSRWNMTLSAGAIYKKNNSHFFASLMLDMATPIYRIPRQNSSE